MIRALLNIVGVKSGDTVLDPFVGSGPAALETQLLGINFIGYDISPLCVLQSRVKTESQEVLDAIEEAKEAVLASADPSLFRGAENSALSEVIAQIPDERARNFYRLAELLSHSDVARRGREFAASFVRNVEAMLTSVRDYREVADELELQLGKVNISQIDARRLPLKSGSVDAVISSPPYSIALDYVANDAHALTALGYDLHKARELFIGVRGVGQKRVELYDQDMKQVIEEMHRVLKFGRYCVLVLGNATYQGKEIPTVEFATEVCKGLGMTLVREIEKIIFGLYNVMQSESILVFRKE